MREVGAHVVAQGPERQPRRAGAQPGDHAEMGVLLQLERRVALFHRATEGVKRAGARIAGPGEDQLPGAARGDHLVVDEVGGEAAEGEIAPALPDDLVARREADEVGEPLDDHGVAVADQRRDGVTHGDDLGARAQSSSPSRPSMMASAVSTSCSSTTSGGASLSVLFPAPSSSRPR